MRSGKGIASPPGREGKGAPKTVDEYIDRAEEPARAMLTRMRAAIRSALPREATETISYRMPAFRHGKVLVWFAAFSDHCSLFPTAAVIDVLKDELKGLKISKGTIQFPLDKPLPISLIKKVVRARLVQSEGGGRR